MNKNSRARRAFLKGAVTVAAAAGAPIAASAQQPTNTTRPATAPPNAQQRAAETTPPTAANIQIIERPGADFMVDVIRSLGFEYVLANPGSSFRGLHESLVNYGGNNPEFITCLHEESSVAMANGYAKVEGKPALVCVHGTVGLQHAAMAVYNAYCDQAPVVIIGGNIGDAVERRGRVDWVHSVQDVASMVRDFTKWDDNPVSLQHWAESCVRAYQVSMTPPMMPVVVTCDAVLQDQPIPAERPTIPRLGKLTPPAADSAVIDEIARIVVAAENPLILCGRSARTPAGLGLVVELAEALECGVIDEQRRMNFPTRHRLNQTQRARGALAEADVVLGLEVLDFYGSVHALGGQTRVIPRSLLRSGTKLVSINSSDLFYKSNYQNFQRYQEVDLSVAADAEASLPALIDAIRRLMSTDRRTALSARAARLGEFSSRALEQSREDATWAWDSSPISTARLSAELWNGIKGEDWSLVSDPYWVSNWPLRLWDFTRHYQYIGGAGGEGVGYTAPATIGAALANRKYGRITVSIQSDGDLMYANGILWTAAHHRIPILIVMHNNRAYHQEVMGMQVMANQHNRGVERSTVGTVLTDPNIDYAKLAESMGVRGIGPIENPRELGPAIQRGLEIVKRGEPCLIDVITQPR